MTPDGLEDYYRQTKVAKSSPFISDGVKRQTTKLTKNNILPVIF